MKSSEISCSLIKVMKLFSHKSICSITLKNLIWCSNTYVDVCGKKINECLRQRKYDPI